MEFPLLKSQISNEPLSSPTDDSSEGQISVLTMKTEKHQDKECNHKNLFRSFSILSFDIESQFKELEQRKKCLNKKRHFISKLADASLIKLRRLPIRLKLKRITTNPGKKPRPTVLPLDSRSTVLSLDSRPTVLSLDSRPTVLPLDSRPTVLSLDSRPTVLSLDSRPTVLPLDSPSPECTHLGVSSESSFIVDICDEKHIQCNSLPPQTADRLKDGQDSTLKRSKDLKLITSRFAGDTTAHGYKNIISENRGFVHKLSWVAAIAFVTILLLVFVKRVWFQYQTHQFTSIVKSQPSRSLRFPSITVCNTVPWIANITDTKYFYDKDLERVEMYEDASHSPFISEFSSVSLIKFHEMFGVTQDEFIKKCTWNNEDIVCQEHFKRAISDTSDCYTFNSNGSATFNATSVGPMAGLRIELSLTPDQLQYGAKIVIHDHEEFPNVIEKGILVGAGNLVHIGLTKKEYSFLPWPFMAYNTEYCQDPDYSEMYHKRYYYSSYRGYSECIASCRLDNIIKTCNCRNVDSPNITGVPYCTVNESRCYIDALKKAYQNTSCNCPLPCQKTEYTWRISSSKFDDDNSSIRIKVFYEDLFTRIEKHIPMQTLPAVLGTIGGQMGLLTGCSVLTLIEILELCFLVSLASWSKFRLKIYQIIKNVLQRQ